MDRELIAFLEERFLNLSREIQENTTQQIQGLRAELRTEMSQQTQELRAEMSQQTQELRAEFRTEMSQQIQGLREETLQRFEAVDDSIRHLYILLEASRDRTQQVAEGVALVNEKLDRFQIEIRGELEEVRSLFTVHHRDLDSRVRAQGSRLDKVERATAQHSKAIAALRRRSTKTPS
jgi:hypothetical protein